MPEIEVTKQFKKDLITFVKKGGDVSKFIEATSHLYNGTPLPQKFQDHNLSGKLSGLKSFSLENDIRVIYRDGQKRKTLIRLGTHNEVY